ncbi:site-specific DNA-methyltransferase [Chromobacterium vaccinii]|uniref:site-specific DNA-methyltransferase n=1 Tax=Chromobacterium vaccinii TaxID=1108595 RepID=UPI001E2AFE14|nr:site-specific DNA-methyltransferase [Chromobacterium vaccinii]MCD4501987.1 site-specific DNA-methyltransferase [Chromobacterium vaccinii]
MAKQDSNTIDVVTLTHDDKRKNIPSAEHEPVLPDEHKQVKTLRYPRNPDLDPQLVWRGKDVQDGTDLIVQAPPLYIQEKVHPKALIDDLKRVSQQAAYEAGEGMLDLFADFNGLPKDVDKTEFYQHDQHWTNRMILGDSLSVMGSLAEREGLRGKVQCIYFDPPYGIKFNSNFQWSTTSRDVKDGKAEHITREPEQVKAFRDTWKDGIHSYLSYIRDRLTVARDLLSESGSIFVQIGDENVHRVRAVMDEVFGEENLVSQIAFRTTTGRAGDYLAAASNYLIWYARNRNSCKYRPMYQDKSAGSSTDQVYSLIRFEDGVSLRMTPAQRKGIESLPKGGRQFRPDNITSSRSAGDGDVRSFQLEGRNYTPGKGTFKTDMGGLQRLAKSSRIWPTINGTIQYIRYLDDFPVIPFSNVWTDTGTGSFTDDKVYVVQTGSKVIERCLLMTTDPGDLVLDPTCGSGTTAYVAEQWGRRWITIDTSRVALALARARLMGARYPFYMLADSPEGLQKEASLSGRSYVEKPTYGKVRQGFVYERVPHITLKSIANNAEIGVIYDNWQPKVLEALARLNKALRGHAQPFKVTVGGRAGKEVHFNGPETSTVKLPSGETVVSYQLLEWEVPREAPKDWPETSAQLLTDFWTVRIGRQKEIDASIAAKAEFEYLYDKPFEDKKTVRVAGPFTVESLSPHRMLGVDENDDLIDPLKVQEQQADYGVVQTFDQMVLENLRSAGVQQAHKEDRIVFTSLSGWPGHFIGAEGRFLEGEAEKRAGILIGPEFGTVSRSDLVEAAREAADAGFDVLIALAFNFDAHAGEFNKLGRVPILKARMNADLHMAADLKATGKGNLFVIFGEPDIELLPQENGQVCVKVNGVDVFDPSTGEVRSDDVDGIACWLVDTDYNGESFFVRHAYFLGQNDPYKSLKTSLKAEINEDAWASLNSDISRPFNKPKSGRIAVKVINHLGDEVMKVFRA